jgi:hypothetical protein
VLTECRSDARGIVARQRLIIRRGNCDPVTVPGTDSGEVGPLKDPLEIIPDLSLCQVWAAFRIGEGSAVSGTFQRIGVTADGSGVVFEVSNALPEYPLYSVPPEKEGFWFVRADGTGLRRLHEPSRVPFFRALQTFPFVTGEIRPIGFSPDGRRIVFLDRGPGPDGQEAVQIVTSTLANGRRMQLTHLPDAKSTSPSIPDTGLPRFVSNRAITFLTHADPDGSNPGHEPRYFEVRTRSGRLRPVAVPRPTRGEIHPTFTISGGGTILIELAFPGVPENAPDILEVGALSGQDLLQLTRFGRADTQGGFLTPDGQRAFFFASADPFGDNPSENCQVFSINRHGRGLRQVTHFRHTDKSDIGCGSLPAGDGCFFTLAFLDPVTQAVVFSTTCDPFCTRKHGEAPCDLGGNIFAMRPDGTGLRQLTHASTVTPIDGGVRVELPGPWAYSGIGR